MERDIANMNSIETKPCLLTQTNWVLGSHYKNLRNYTTKFIYYSNEYTGNIVLKGINQDMFNHQFILSLTKTALSPGQKRYNYNCLN